MFEYNTIGIKDSDDLQEALLIEHDASEFVFQVKSMIDRWGIQGTLEMLGAALCGSPGAVKPLIPFRHKYVLAPDGEFILRPIRNK